MNKCQQEKIEKYRDDLIENTWFNDLWQTLTDPSFGNQHKQIFTDEMINDILDPDNDCGNESRNERFYDLIVTSTNPDAFNILKNALSSSGHDDIVEYLLEDKPECTAVDMSRPRRNTNLALPPLLGKIKVSRSKSLSTWATVSRRYTSYLVQSSPRGYLLLINMRFIMNPLAEERLGSEVDIENLKSLFTQLNYKIVDHYDLKLDEIEKKIEEFSHMEELAKVDSVFVFVMSHGRDPSTRKPGDPPLKSPGRESVDIELEDNKFINSNDIVDKINESPTIRPNTPRKFFFNVCRGENTDWGPNGRARAYISSDHIADSSTQVDAKPFTPFDPTPSNLTKPISSPNENGLNRPHARSNGNGSEVTYSSIEMSPAGPSRSNSSGLHLPQFIPNENGFNGLGINSIELAPNGPYPPQNSSRGNSSSGSHLPQVSPNENGFNGPEVRSIETIPAGPAHLPQNGPIQNGFNGSHLPQVGTSGNVSHVSNGQTLPGNKNKDIGNNSDYNLLVINQHHGSEHKSQHGNTPNDTNHAQSNGFVEPHLEGPSARFQRNNSHKLVLHSGAAPTLPQLEPTNYSTSCCCIPLSNKRDKSLARCAVWFARFFKCSMPCIRTEDTIDRVGVMRALTIEIENEPTADSSSLVNGQRQTEPTVSSNPGGSQHATEPIDIPPTLLPVEESSEGRSHSPRGSATSNGSIRNTINGVLQTISMHLPHKSHTRGTLTGDIFIAFSTVDGYNSKRDELRGSWFITFICQVFAEKAIDTDLLSMMEEVDRLMRERCDAVYGTQMYVKKTEGFSKKFFFNLDEY